MLQKVSKVAKSCKFCKSCKKLQIYLKVAKRMQIYPKVAFLHPCNKNMALLIVGVIFDGKGARRYKYNSGEIHAREGRVGRQVEFQGREAVDCPP